MVDTSSRYFVVEEPRLFPANCAVTHKTSPKAGPYVSLGQLRHDGEFYLAASVISELHALLTDAGWVDPRHEVEELGEELVDATTPEEKANYERYGLVYDAIRSAVTDAVNSTLDTHFEITSSKPESADGKPDVPVEPAIIQGLNDILDPPRTGAKSK